MARGAGGLRHVGAAAARGARAPPRQLLGCYSLTATAYSKTRCATALLRFCCQLSRCRLRICKRRARELAALDARGAFRGRQEVRVLFTGTKQESSLETHASVKAVFFVARIPLRAGDELDTDPPSRGDRRKHISTFAVERV